MSRYEPLHWFLAKLPPDRREVRMSFRDIERIVGALPDSARNYRPWWGNSEVMPQALAWQRAGFVVDQVNLTAESVVFARGRAQRRSTGGPVTVRRVAGPTPDGHSVASSPPVRPATPAGDPQSEAAVQARLVAYLAARGWRIERVADTAARERGLDVLASREGVTLAVEVKGYPSRAYADARRANEIKPTEPGVQARHWYAMALLKALLIRDEHADYAVAIALPDVATYRSLHRRTSTSLTALGIATLFVTVDGEVTAHGAGAL